MTRIFRQGGSFAWVMVGLMALGIGATTAMFSVINGVLWQPLAVPHPEQLVLLGESIPEEPAASAKFAYFDNPIAYLTWQREATSFTGMAALQSSTFTLTGAGRPLQLHGAKVWPNFFDVLTVHAALGRTLTAADANDPTRPMVITDSLWRSAFGANPNVIGQHVGPSDSGARIVGVLPASFDLGGRSLGPMTTGYPTQYFVPLQFGRDENTGVRDAFTDFNYHVVARLKPGVTVAMAKAQLDGVQANLARAANEKLTLASIVTPLLDYTVADASQQLWLLMGGVLAVLLVVCVNLGGLWVTRIADRRRDWAIRAALGAAPGRLVRQVLGESLVLGFAGGVVGMGLAALGLQALLASAPAGIPRLDQVHLDARVLGFGLLLSLAAGLLTGLVPAWRLSRADPQEQLKASGAATTADRSSLRSRYVLIGLQAALSTVLLAAAGLLGLSFYKLVSQQAGVQYEHAMAAEVVLNAYKEDQRVQLMGQLPAAAAAIPGVRSAALTSLLPLQGETWIDSASVPGKTYPATGSPSVNVRFITPNYFATMDIPLLGGRDFTAADQQLKPMPVILSRAAVVALWPELAQHPEQAVGRPLNVNGQRVTFIGLADDARTSFKTAAPPLVYQGYWEWPSSQMSLVVRSTLPPAALAGAVRDAVWKLAPMAPIPRLRPLSAVRDAAVAPERYQLNMLLLFAALAGGRAALGVYALVSHNVARRSKELAIRISIGAGAAQVWQLVVRQALVPVAAGVLAGLAVAFAVGRLLATMLFEVSPTSPAVLAAVAAAVLLAALAACLWPAWRATRTDPLQALRAE
ncbi:MAG: ADOP family duplicated permease [Terriglobales bacterium]